MAQFRQQNLALPYPQQAHQMNMLCYHRPNHRYLLGC
jgi:hypothetical protein